MKRIGLVIVCLTLVAVAPLYAQDDLSLPEPADKVATSGDTLVLETPSQPDVNLPGVVNPYEACKAKTPWGYSYVVLGLALVAVGLLYRPKSQTALAGMLATVTVGALLIQGIIGCSCTESLWCSRFWVVAILGAIATFGSRLYLTDNKRK